MENNSAFISYRRDVSAYIARAVFQDLRSHDINVFMDIESIDSGQFDSVILNQIAARPYFLLILTPGSLDRVNEPGDWLRREIEHAISLKRVIVPLLTPNFSYDPVRPLLKGAMASLPTFNGVTVPHDYFEEAMERLRKRFLKPVRLESVPTPVADQPVVQHKLQEAIAAPLITGEQLSAQDCFERGIALAKEGRTAEAIEAYSEVLRIDPEFLLAYILRGNVYLATGDFDEAIDNYSQAIDLDPTLSDAFYKRGITYRDKGDYFSAIGDFHKVLQLQPQHRNAQYMRDRIAEWIKRE